MWGGLVQFEDGTTAEMRNTHTPSFTIGSDYLLFLSRLENSNTYSPSNGPQAVFGFDLSARVVPFARPTDVVFKYRGMPRTILSIKSAQIFL